MIKDYNEAMKMVHQQKELVTKLEKDLLSVNALSARYRGEGEGQASTDIIAEVVKDKGVLLSPTSAVQGSVELVSAAESLLPIISSQRERFRQRVQELEDQNFQQQQQFYLLQGEADRLRTDNIKLYEKIKFLQSYPATQKSNRARAADETIERHYSSQYEENLDPFATFSKKERQRKYTNLSPFEKITLGMGRMILSSKAARTITFIYSVLLHCLVFLVLYKLAYTEEWKRDMSSTCAERFAEHMQQVHGEHVPSLDPR